MKRILITFVTAISVFGLSGCWVTTAQLDRTIHELKGELSDPATTLSLPLMEIRQSNFHDLKPTADGKGYRVEFSESFKAAFATAYPPAQEHLPIVSLWILRHGNKGSQFDLPAGLPTPRVLKITSEYFIFEKTFDHKNHYGAVGWIVAGPTLRK